jgi:hypothetical protein
VGGSRERLLVAGRVGTEPGYGETAPNKFRFDLSNPAQIRRATEEEWASGVEMPFPKPYEDAIVKAKLPDHALVEFKGKRFGKSGKRWPADHMSIALASPGGRWLVTQSADGGCCGSIWSPFGPGNGDPAGGPIYIDVFEVARSRKVLTITGRLMNVGASSFYQPTGWLAENLLYVKLDTFNRSFILCDPTKAK